MVSAEKLIFIEPKELTGQDGKPYQYCLGEEVQPKHKDMCYGKDKAGKKVLRCFVNHEADLTPQKKEDIKTYHRQVKEAAEEAARKKKAS